MPQLNRIALTALIVAYALGPLATQIVTPAVPFVLVGTNPVVPGPVSAPVL